MGADRDRGAWMNANRTPSPGQGPPPISSWPVCRRGQVGLPGFAQCRSACTCSLPKPPGDGQRISSGGLSS